MDIVWEDKMRCSNINDCRRFRTFQEIMLPLPELLPVSCCACGGRDAALCFALVLFVFAPEGYVLGRRAGVCVCVCVCVLLTCTPAKYLYA